MAGYPQIPSTVWWGLRTVLQRNPGATIDERYLSVQLNVQEAAARQYVSELKRVGIITEEGRATPLAAKWRHDETYKDAIKEIMEQNYPSALLEIAPPEEGDRQKVVSWFTKEGLGTGTANNKAATYFLIGTPIPGEAPTKPASQEKQAAPSKPKTTVKNSSINETSERGKSTTSSHLPPLNINMQIHISADATNEQIESIFSAMRRHLYENQAS